MQGRVEISISGYDDDPRELSEISEVVAWYRLADPVFREWFFFLNTKGHAPGLKTYFACLASRKRLKSAKPGHVRFSLYRSKVAKLFETNFLRLNEMTQRLNMSEEENKKSSYSIMDVTRRKIQPISSLMIVETAFTPDSPVCLCLVSVGKRRRGMRSQAYATEPKSVAAQPSPPARRSRPGYS